MDPRSVRHARGDLGRSSLSPAVRLRWPPPGEHAAAPGPASLVASQDSAPAAGCGAPAPPAEIGSARLCRADRATTGAHLPHLALNESGQRFQLNGAECLERSERGFENQFFRREPTDLLAVPTEFARPGEDRPIKIILVGDRVATAQARTVDGRCCRRKLNASSYRLHGIRR